ncbi:MAG: protein kinase [Lachnospiraceae bacterium]|nr:protein kinase [Lachnospiraceae bacterium]
MIYTEEDGILCPSCMMPQRAVNGLTFCSDCGSPMEIENKPYQLKPGTMIANRYIVGRVLGQGGFGITYIGYDTKLSGRVAIKEYFPVGCVDRRAGDGTDITVTAGNEAPVFERQKKRFIEEAKILARFLTERTIVSVSDIITENNTAYTVMSLILGRTLSEYLKDRGKMSFNEAYSMMRPIMVSLGKVHAAGLIHRDLSPSNIMVQEDGSLILLDFGSAREYDEDNDRSMSVILKPGYAPSEQYVSHGLQGPWTDVYSMCATIYKMITGVTPANALMRMGADTLKAPSELGSAISPEQEAVLLKGLGVNMDSRYHTMDDLIHALDGAVEGDVTRMLFTAPAAPEQRAETRTAVEYRAAEPEPVVHQPVVNNVAPKPVMDERTAAAVAADQTVYIYGTPQAVVSQKTGAQTQTIHTQTPQTTSSQAVASPVQGSQATVSPAGTAPAQTTQTPRAQAQATKPATAPAVAEQKEERPAAETKTVKTPKKRGIKAWMVIAAAVIVIGIIVAAVAVIKRVRSSDDMAAYTINDEGYIVFGRYEQDGNTSNGPEDIEWEIIKIDEENNRLFLVSRYILDCQPYNSESVYVNWETCSLRSWLNEDFCDSAFTEAEKKRILTTKLSNLPNSTFDTFGGKDTEDKLFCLSIDDIEAKYTCNHGDSEKNVKYYQDLMTEATPYAESEKVKVTMSAISMNDFDSLYDAIGYDRSCIGNRCGYWWLRNPDKLGQSAYYSSPDGVIGWHNPVAKAGIGVRPAMYIKRL